MAFKYTPTLNLPILGDSVSEKEMSVLEWRLGVNGLTGSGFTKIDEFAKNTNNQLEEKINKTQIKNNLTETTTGNVLDASQGKILNDKVNNLSTNKADKNKVFSTAIGYIQGTDDFNNKIESGTYHIADATNCLNRPPSVNPSYSTMNVYTTLLDKSQAYIVQEIISVGLAFVLVRCRNNRGEWTPWIDLSTTKKMEILFVPQNNITLISNNSYLINNIAYIDVLVKLTDENTFNKGATYTIGNVGITKPIPRNIPLVATAWNNLIGNVFDGTSTALNATLLADKMIYVVINGSNTKSISLSGRVIL